MCLACVGSCPEAAILDNAEAPQVRFIESKCVQCGICEKTCPEHAISLTPRLSLDPGAKAPRVLNEAAPLGESDLGGVWDRTARRIPPRGRTLLPINQSDTHFD